MYKISEVKLSKYVETWFIGVKRKRERNGKGDIYPHKCHGSGLYKKEYAYA